MSLPSIKIGLMTCLRTVFPSIEWNQDDLVCFLKVVGIMNPGGKPYFEREKKLYEVIYFSSHVVKSVEAISRRHEVVLLDSGCGRSYLPFFINYVLRKKRRDITYNGIDTNLKLIEKSSQIAKSLGYTNMEFSQSSIIEFKPEREVNIVCALHACDTATDEAIAKGIMLKARFIIAAPCCQRQVVQKVGGIIRRAPELRPLVDSKVSKEYVGVALTEVLRKLVLESFGYKVDMFEFMSATYTPKNIMIRAEKVREWSIVSLNAYKALRDYFNVEPKIQDFLPQIK